MKPNGAEPQGLLTSILTHYEVDVGAKVELQTFMAHEVLDAHMLDDTIFCLTLQTKKERQICLTPSLRRPCKHEFCFLRVMPEAVSTRHSWL